jgi:hypothetical protein
MVEAPLPRREQGSNQAGVGLEDGHGCLDMEQWVEVRAQYLEVDAADACESEQRCSTAHEQVVHLGLVAIGMPQDLLEIMMVNDRLAERADLRNLHSAVPTLQLTDPLLEETAEYPTNRKFHPVVGVVRVDKAELCQSMLCFTQPKGDFSPERLEKLNDLSLCS